MASSATHTSAGFFENRCAYSIRSCRHFANTDSHRIVNRVENRRRGWNHSLLANPLRPKRTDGRRLFDQNGLDLRHISSRRNQVIVQVLTLARKELLHQRHAETLRHAALDLS